MKIISWNVNGIRANVKKGGFDWLVSQDADIFCVQETKAQADQLPENILKPTGYVSYFDHSKFEKAIVAWLFGRKKFQRKLNMVLVWKNWTKKADRLALFFNSDAKI